MSEDDLNQVKQLIVETVNSLSVKFVESRLYVSLGAETPGGGTMQKASFDDLPVGKVPLPEFPSLPDSLQKRMSGQEKNDWQKRIGDYKKSLTVAIRGKA